MDNEQERYIEYRTLTEQLKKIREYQQQTQENIVELGKLKESFDRFRELKKGQRILAPITNGVFVDATLNDPTTFHMNIGADVVVTKSIDEAKELITKQEKEMAKLHARATKDEEQLVARMREIEKHVEQE
ncbi:prefoldin subunit alpha [Candidatus Woesearchaeota archaeon]|nr:MAG: prefoldin subunit alpha [Candidatus Woesearchaeota archaeon]